LIRVPSVFIFSSTFEWSGITFTPVNLKLLVYVNVRGAWQAKFTSEFLI
jgi:hypothetical protein